MINSVKTYDTFEMKTLNGYILKLVNDYKYLGSYISSSEKDFNTRKGMAWSACNDLHKIWVSDLHVNMKIDIFKTLIEPILLYGSETWSSASLRGVETLYRKAIKITFNMRNNTPSELIFIETDL